MSFPRAIGVAMLVGLSWPAQARAQEQPASPQEQLSVCIASFEEAQLKERRGKLVFARKLYSDCSSNVCPKPLREDCAQHHAAIEKAVPSISLVVRDATGKDLEATFKVDGAAFAAQAGRAMPIDPGVHDLEYAVKGQAPVGSKVTIAEGEKSRLVVLTAPTVGTEPRAASIPAEHGTVASPSLVGPIIIGTVGGLMMLAGVGYYVLASSEASERDQQRAAAAAATTESEKSAYDTSAESHARAARDNQLLAILVGSGGLVAISAAVVLYVVQRPSKTRALTPRVTPVLGPAHAGASLGFAF